MISLKKSFILILFFLLYEVHSFDLQHILDKQNTTKQKLLLVLIDGARWDYINETHIKSLPGFQRLANEGVKAEYNEPIYPANSYPNWYTVTTGLHAESHGFVDNIMYDPIRKEYFEMQPHPNATHSHWWNKTEPIWINAERSGIRTAMWNWGGCSVDFNGTSATFCMDFKWMWDSVKEDTIKAADQILDGLKNDTYGLGMLYYLPVDKMGHLYGPFSPKCQEAVRNASDILNAIQEKIVAKGLSDILNVYVVSDHGMTSPDKYIHLSKHINYSDILAMTGGGSIFNILSINEKATERIYKQLQKANVTGLHYYLKQNIPEEFHLKNNRLTHQILLRSAPGYRINATSEDPRFSKMPWLNSRGKPMVSIHGYFIKELDQMRGIMLAKGPAFKRGYKQPSIKQLDHYNVFCHILGINPHPNNGSWPRIKDMLK